MHNYHKEKTYNMSSRYSFKNFLLSEGGNVIIGNTSAERIDLKKFPREAAIASFKNGLNAINDAFQKMHGVPLWDEHLIKSIDFLSGSTKSFFDQSIPTDEFVANKSSLGDLDLMVDGAMADLIQMFLDKSKNKNFGPLKLVGYKKSGEQFITIFRSDLGINVQIDL